MATDEETNEMLKKFWDANEKLILAAINAFATSGEKKYKGVHEAQKAITEFIDNKDYTKYSINGQGEYNKRKLVENVVRLIISKGGDVMGTLKNLDDKCAKSLLRTQDFYNKDKSRAVELEYNGSSIYISNQWGIHNIPSFIEAVNSDHTIGLSIQEVNTTLLTGQTN